MSSWSKRLQSILVAAAALAAPLASSGCFIDNDDDIYVPPTRVGAVTIRWSIAGAFDPSACDAFGVADARIDLYDGFGQPIQTTFVDCRAFAARFDLIEGRYSARVEMVDPARQPLSTSVAISPFTIVGGTNLNIDTDFPPDSFF